MKRLVCLLFVLVSTVSAVGCNTFQGLGKDIEKGGQAINKAATK